MSVRDPLIAAQLLWAPEPPYEDEGLLSFVTRCAAEQYISSQHSIMREAGQVYANRPTARLNGDLNVDRLADCLMVDVSEVERRNYKLIGGGSHLSFFGADIPSWHVWSATRRFSPASLRNAPYGRGSWEHALIPFCSRSWEYLTDRCPHSGCRASQGWRHTTGIDNCDKCVGPLTIAARRVVPEEWRPALSFIAGLVSSCPHEAAAAAAQLPKELSGMNRGEAFVLGLQLFPMCGHKAMIPQTITWWRKRPFRLTAALAHAGNLILNWPQGVTNHIADHIGHRTGRNSNKLHHAASAFLSASWADPESRTARVLKELTSTRQADGHGRETCSQDSLSIIIVSQRLGAGTAEIACARRCGALKTSLMLRGGELVPAFCRDEISLLEGVLARRLSPWQCALVLGLPSYAVEHLAELGELEHEDHPYLTFRFPRWPFLDEQKVQQYVDSAEAGASEMATLGRSVRLADLMKQVGGRLKPWATAFAAMREGLVKYALIAESAPLSQRIIVSEKQASHILALPSPGTLQRDGSPRMMSRGDALEVLNQGCKLSPALARYESGEDTRNGQALKAETVVALGSSVISASEIGSRFGIGEAAVVAHAMRSAGVQRANRFGWPREEATALFSSDHCQPVRSLKNR